MEMKPKQYNDDSWVWGAGGLTKCRLQQMCHPPPLPDRKYKYRELLANPKVKAKKLRPSQFTISVLCPYVNVSGKEI